MERMLKQTSSEQQDAYQNSNRWFCMRGMVNSLQLTEKVKMVDAILCTDPRRV
uniref:Uncharacterized protein n=1 Tax=Arundo donax TaxID=35708 RepID=A0A0A9EFR9_ARUDO